jgi:hypothetical protein
MITLKQLQDLPPRKIFRTGIVRNNEDGIFMTSHRKNDWLKWVAVRGQIDDWAIYVGWDDWGTNQIYQSGDKVMDEKAIREFIHCDDEVFN